jgi:hypothetical protein
MFYGKSSVNTENRLPSGKYGLSIALNVDIWLTLLSGQRRELSARSKMKNEKAK